MKKFYLLILLIVFISIGNIQAQTKLRHVFVAFSPSISFKIANVPNSVIGPDNTKLDVCRRYRIKDVINDIKNDKGYCAGDFRAGLDITLLAPREHVGLRLGIDYVNSGFRMKYPGNDEFDRHDAKGISPELLFRITTGDFMKRTHFVVEMGGAYTYNFAYKGSFDNSKDIVGNGFSGIAGIGFDTYGETTVYVNGKYNQNASDNMNKKVRMYFAMMLEYRYDFYNYFNESYTPDGVTYPYKGFKSKRGGLFFNFSIGFKI